MNLKTYLRARMANKEAERQSAEKHDRQTRRKGCGLRYKLCDHGRIRVRCNHFTRRTIALDRVGQIRPNGQTFEKVIEGRCIGVRGH